MEKSGLPLSGDIDCVVEAMMCLKGWKEGVWVWSESRDSVSLQLFIVKTSRSAPTTV